MTDINHFSSISQHTEFANKNIEDLKKSGLDLIKNIDFPTRRDENWKYTNLKSFLTNDYQFQVIKSEMPKLPEENAAFYNINIVNGEFRNIEVPGVKIYKLSDISDEIDTTFMKKDNHFKDDILSALGNSQLKQGIVFHVQENQKVDKPVCINHINFGDKNYINTTNIFIVDKNASLDLVEMQQSQNDIFINSNYYVSVGENAQFEHIVEQDNDLDAIATLQIQSSLAANATYNQNIINQGSKLSRSNIAATLNGENATAHINGLYLLSDKQHHDTLSFIKHNHHHTYSHQLYKGILDESSRGVFTGKVRVEKDAQQIDAKQLNKNLLLSNKAHANSRPQLEIYADDVKCAHGSTTGQLSDDQIFYFESRGIKPDKARKMIAKGYAYDVILKINNLHIKEKITTSLNEDFMERL